MAKRKGRHSIELWAEYRCGHAKRLIASGRVRLSHYAKDLKDITAKATSKITGLVQFNCKQCNRGAAFTVLVLDGKVISRTDCNAAFRNMAGAIVSPAPDDDRN